MRRIFSFLALLSLASAASAQIIQMPPTKRPLGAGVGSLALDGIIQASGASTTLAANLTTVSSNDVIIVQIKESGSVAPTVSGIADTAGLTWIKRAGFYTAGGTPQGVEEWYAISPSPLSADAITATWTPTGSHSNRMVAFGVSGANTSTPFDPDASFPASGNENGTNLANNSVTITTTKAADMLINVVGVNSGLNTSLVRASGFSATVVSGSSAVDFSNDIIAATVSSQAETFSWSNSGNTDSGMILDAIQASGQ